MNTSPLCDHSAGETPPLHSALTYTLLDISGSLWGTLIFSAAFLAPGYVAASLLDIADFRRRSFAEQAAWSIALSFGIGTVLIVAAVWSIGVAGVGWLLVALGVLAIALWSRNTTRLQKIEPRSVYLLGGWTLLIILSLVDIGNGGRLWMSVTTYDHAVRTAFVNAVMRTGVVPINPLYWPGHGAALRYYYFWYVTCGVIAKVAHISARQALIASCVWPLPAVAGMLGLYGKYLLGWSGKELRSRTWLGVLLLAVTGLDILEIVFKGFTGRAVPGDMEWWSIDQVTSWIDTFLWVPHHAAALVCCLLCFLLIWMAGAEVRPKQRIIFGVIAGLGFASAFGLSTYVAIGFCLVMLAWLVRVAIVARSGNKKRLLNCTAIATMVAAVALAPYVTQLLHQGVARSGRQQHVIAFEVRQMFDPNMLANAPGLALLGAHHVFVRTEISALILLLPGYGVEFGFFAVAILLALRLPEKTEGERTLLFLFFAGLASVSFLRSTVIMTNDYGVRASLLAQFFALPLAVRVRETAGSRWRSALLILAMIGVTGTIYQGVLLRVFLPWQQALGNPVTRELGERNDAAREAYTLFNQRAPRDARIQYDPAPGGYFNFTQMLNAQHQIVTADATCNTGFGGEIAPCTQILRNVGALFPAQGGNTPSAQAASTLCSPIGIQYLVVTRWDAAWSDTLAWPWHLPVVVATPDVRILFCSA